ncbi:type II toxin-antitoxin system Phd/YefM family antitoxin [Vreelandella sulfidaeris]|uniref:Antitoxin n=1 Tax=Vreelandella sulfidaeris TaxID=115553 RepID=A0A455U3M1_9GAMM|nr:hypothetical protein HSBAA_15030 [Halomonas sulfidaeris]
MDAISYTSARSNLAKTMEQVCEDHSPMNITRNKAQPVVMISLEDYEALQETVYLLRALRAPVVCWNPLSSWNKVVVSKTNFLKTAAPGRAPALISNMVK